MYVTVATTSGQRHSETAPAELALEVTSHSAHFVVVRVLVYVARASAWVLGAKIEGKSCRYAVVVGRSHHAPGDQARYPVEDTVLRCLASLRKKEGYLCTYRRHVPHISRG